MGMAFTNNHYRQKTIIVVLLVCYSCIAWPISSRAGDKAGKPSWQPTAEQRTFIDEVTRLPPEQQVSRVTRKLVEVNLGFNGKTSHKIHGGRVLEFGFNSDHVSKLWPIRGLPDLTVLRCAGSFRQKGILNDLSPLAGMNLVHLNCLDTKVSDLSPLRGMSIVHLDISRTNVVDLTPLEGMPLVHLDCFNTSVTNLSSLRGMPLKWLNCFGTRVTDLKPLTGMPLRKLDASRTKIEDLTPLRGMPLTSMQCTHTSVADLSPLKGMRLELLRCQGTKVSDISLISEMPLATLTIEETLATENVSLLRSLSTLRTVNDQQAKVYLDKLQPTSPPSSLPTTVVTVQDKPKSTELDSARQEFKDRADAAMMSMYELFDKKKEAAVKGGDTQTVKILDNQRERFTRDRILPTVVPTDKFEKDILVAVRSIQKEYQKAITNSGRNGGSASQSAALRAEVDQLIAPFFFDGRRGFNYKTGGFIIQPNSDWRELKKNGWYDVFREVKRTKDYIEIRSKTRDVSLRLYNGRSSLKEGRYPWRHFKSGVWVQ
jgi:hypothetical protein